MSPLDATNPESLFADIDAPSKPNTAEEGEAMAKAAEQAVAVKAERTKTAIEKQQSMIDSAKVEIVKHIADVETNRNAFPLQSVLNGWLFSTEDVQKAIREVSARGSLQMNVENAASYGTVPDSVVSQFINSAATKATGEARLEVARVLDQATGITRKIAEDKSVAAEEVAKKAEELLKVWHNAEMLSALFNRLFKQTINRVVDYQVRLVSVGQELAKKQVTLEEISSSLVARQELVRKCLYDTCVSGMTMENLLEREKQTLADLEAKKAEIEGNVPQALVQKVQDQEELIEIMIKRLVDQKGFAIKLIGLYSVLGNTRKNVAVIKADVVFSHTNLLASLGLQLGLVVDIITTLRISKSAEDLRLAEADVAEKVGVSTTALDMAGRRALLNVDTTIRSLKATISAALAGIANTHENMQLVTDMATKADEEFGAMFKQLAG